MNSPLKVMLVSNLRCVGFADLPITAGTPTNVGKVNRSSCQLVVASLEDSLGKTYEPAAEYAVNYTNDQTLSAQFTATDGSNVVFSQNDDKTIPKNLYIQASGTVFDVEFKVSNE